MTFWKQYEETDKQTDEKTVLPVLRHYTMFNVDQIDGVESPDAVVVDPADFSPLAEAERILAGYAGGPPIDQKGLRAVYLPKLDRIEIAVPERFESGVAYYATLFHEMSHNAAARIMPRCGHAALNHRCFGS